MLDEEETTLTRQLIRAIEKRIEAKYHAALQAKDAEIQRLKEQLRGDEEDPIDVLANLVQHDSPVDPRRMTFPVAEPVRNKQKRRQMHAVDCPCCTHVKARIYLSSFIKSVEPRRTLDIAPVILNRVPHRVTGRWGLVAVVHDKATIIIKLPNRVSSEPTNQI